jgi:hypothetical protein
MGTGQPDSTERRANLLGGIAFNQRDLAGN